MKWWQTADCLVDHSDKRRFLENFSNFSTPSFLFPTSRTGVTIVGTIAGSDPPSRTWYVIRRIVRGFLVKIFV